MGSVNDIFLIHVQLLIPAAWDFREEGFALATVLDVAFTQY